MLRFPILAGCLLYLAGTWSAVPQPDPEAAQALARMEVTLTTTRPYHFVLAYQGPRKPFRGPLCYWFAGYNETCMNPKLDWLTPATEITLHAPGGVPRDLLQGYTLLVRYPAMSERVYRYDLPAPP